MEESNMPKRSKLYRKYKRCVRKVKAKGIARSPHAVCRIATGYGLKKNPIKPIKVKPIKVKKMKIRGIRIKAMKQKKMKSLLEVL